VLLRIFTLLAVAALVISTLILTSPRHRLKPDSDLGAGSLPGYFLKNAILTDYDATGAPGVRIEAERIDQIAHSDQVQLYNVKVDYQPPSGESWTLVGDTAQLTPGAKVVQVQGNVKLTGEASGRDELIPTVRTDSLTYNIAEAVVTTAADVRLEFGAHILTARGLNANLKDQTMRLESRVNGRFHP
jgi:lipopolysaccharide export system protein LptC